jgi:4-carboxymuconolactone decarboxylase
MSRSDEERFEAGMRVRREVLGDGHVDQAIARTDAFTEPFQAFITRTAWADIWDRPGLGRRERSMVTLAALTAMRAEGEISMHVRAAIRNGLTREEIAEILLHVSIYAGLPAGNAAFAIAQATLEELDGSADSGKR